MKLNGSHERTSKIRPRFLEWARRTLLAGLAFGLTGCASGPVSGSPSRSLDGTSPAGSRLLRLSMTVNPNGRIDTSGRGYYIFLINAQGQQIEVTDLDTFTDFIRFDGHNYDWYHRQAQQPRPGFQFFQAGNLNVAGRITTDGRAIEVILDVGDSTNLINQFVATNTFTVHALTCDNFQSAIIGRALDTLGAGPNLSNNSLQTILAQKDVGALAPFPQFYPIDPLSDFIAQPDLAPDFPYANFDIARMDVVGLGQ